MKRYLLAAPVTAAHVYAVSAACCASSCPSVVRAGVSLATAWALSTLHPLSAASVKPWRSAKSAALAALLNRTAPEDEAGLVWAAFVVAADAVAGRIRNAPRAVDVACRISGRLDAEADA